jgi:probable HAF family extracellular repeat protein
LAGLSNSVTGMIATTGTANTVPLINVRYSLTVLPTLGGTFGLAGGLNNRGSVAGNSTLPSDLVEHAFRLQNGVMTDLGTLGGPNSFTQESFTPINARGTVTGLCGHLHSRSEWRGCLWRR